MPVSCITCPSIHGLASFSCSIPIPILHRDLQHLHASAGPRAYMTPACPRQRSPSICTPNVQIYPVTMCRGVCCQQLMSSPSSSSVGSQPCHSDVPFPAPLSTGGPIGKRISPLRGTTPIAIIHPPKRPRPQSCRQSPSLAAVWRQPGMVLRPRAFHGDGWPSQTQWHSGEVSWSGAWLVVR
jgi:hypothetical protein